ncbi:MAG: hypothetical protein AAGF45_07325 [Pseudomonadota bacterium]
MLTVAETRRSLYGALLLFRGRDAGLGYLDRSLDGFWRSFAVVFLLVPLNALTMYAVSKSSGQAFGGLFWEQLPILVVNWVAFPIALALVAGPLGVSRDYVSYVVARNWAAPVSATIMMVPFLLEGAGWLPQTGAALLSLVALIVVLRFNYLVLRIALKVAVPLAIGMVIADFVLTLVIIAILS